MVASRPQHTLVIDVTLPEGVSAGESFVVTTADGADFSVVCPEGIVAGDALQVEVVVDGAVADESSLTVIEEEDLATAEPKPAPAGDSSSRSAASTFRADEPVVEDPIFVGLDVRVPPIGCSSADGKLVDARVKRVYRYAPGGVDALYTVELATGETRTLAAADVHAAEDDGRELQSMRETVRSMAGVLHGVLGVLPSGEGRA